ncbi:MAG TPA: tetratricopeptide repeat protein [Opitutaceae bacterium]|nr:tetratricopeptide repeat protein [Opitutaceae bacterium]
MAASRKSRPAKIVPPKPSPWDSRWLPFVAGGLLILAALAAYHNSFSGPFIFDDELWITKNPTIRHLWPVWPVLSPPPGLIVRGRPLLNLSLAINYALGGTNVWGYHALNLAVHIIAGLALFGIVRRTLRQPAMRGRFPASAGLAFAVAAIWMLHPLQTEAVTYVIQRAESLMAMFYLLTLYCFVRGTDSRAPGIWQAFSIAACLCGMATKEVMVSAPLIVLLYDRTFVAGSFREAWRQRWRVYLGLAVTWLELAYLMAGIGSRGAGFDLGITGWTYALTECPVVVHYLWLAVWPHPLILDYGGDVVKHAGEAAPYALILVMLVGGTVVALWRWPAWGFAGAWTFAVLAPTSSFVPVAFQPMAEHRMYLPLAAVVAVVVLGIYTGLGRRSVAVYLALAMGLGLLTATRNEDYRSELAIWRDTVAKRPGNPRAQYYLGLVLARAGQLPEALEHFQEAVRDKVDYAEAYNNTGTCLLLLNRAAEAVGQYEQALAYKPNYPEAQCNLGIALFNLGRFEEAAQHYQEAVRLQPDYADAHSSLAATWERMGRTAEAIRQYEEALRINPGLAAARDSLARLQAQQQPASNGK